MPYLGREILNIPFCLIKQNTTKKKTFFLTSFFLVTKNNPLGSYKFIEVFQLEEEIKKRRKK